MQSAIVHMRIKNNPSCIVSYSPRETSLTHRPCFCTEPCSKSHARQFNIIRCFPREGGRLALCEKPRANVQSYNPHFAWKTQTDIDGALSGKTADTYETVQAYSRAAQTHTRARIRTCIDETYYYCMFHKKHCT